MVGQLAGASTLQSEVRSALTDRRYQDFRFLVAFARWSGIHLLHDELQNFSLRKGTRTLGVVGVDLGGTTVEALTYLHELPNATIKIFRSGNPRIVFHPKIFMFEGADAWRAIVGSSNLTSGGLFTNAEGGLVVDGSTKETNPALQYWRQIFEAHAPLKPEHVQLVDAALLEAIAPELDSYRTKAPDVGKSRATGTPQLKLSAPLPAVGRPPLPRKEKPKEPQHKKRQSKQPGPITAPASRATLYMELWDETGGGTQVQMGKAVFENFFGATPSTVTWVDLDTPDGHDRVRLQEFANSTYRIPLAFVRQIPANGRRAVLRFRRTASDKYKVDVAVEGDRSYSTWLAKCRTRQNSRSKGYGIYE